MTSISLRLFCRAPTIVERPVRRRLPRASGTAIDLRPERYWPVRLSGAAARSAIVPSATTSPPLTPGPGPKSTRWSAARIVSSSCSTTITVLPTSRSRCERGDQAVVVAGVQADRGLVEDVEHADQPRADLAGQPDPLRLAARERRRRAVEAQVVEADVGQEAEPAPDLLEQLLGDRPRERVERLGRSSSARSAAGLPPGRRRTGRPCRSAARPARPASCRRPGRPGRGR